MSDKVILEDEYYLEQLFQKRIILINKEFTEQTCGEWIARLILLDLTSGKTKKPIVVLINSYGGDTYAAFGLVDVIKNCISPVITCCIGIAHSSGSIILAAGNERYALPNSSIMIHEHTTTFNNSIKHSDMINEVEAGKKTFKTLEDYYVNTTNQPRTKINKLLKKDSYMSAKEAKNMNLIDDITWDIHNWLK